MSIITSVSTYRGKNTPQELGIWSRAAAGEVSNMSSICGIERGFCRASDVREALEKNAEKHGIEPFEIERVIYAMSTSGDVKVIKTSRGKDLMDAESAVEFLRQYPCGKNR